MRLRQEVQALPWALGVVSINWLAIKWLGRQLSPASHLKAFHLVWCLPIFRGTTNGRRSLS